MAGTVVGEAFVAIRPQTEGFAAEAQSKIAAPLQAAFAGIATGVAAQKVKSFFTDAFGEATEAAKVTAQTGAVLKSTGEIAGVTAGHIENLAGKLSDLAAIDDEVIQQGENVLLTFTSIRNEAGRGNDVFDRATEAALNMSVALGTDLQGSIIQVGKALNDPIQGMAALRRVGVSFTESQKEQIATLQQSGDLLGAQKVILQELEKEFGGAAASQATATARLQVAFKNLEESIGTALLPLINGLAKALQPLAQFFADNQIAATALAVVLSGALLAGLTAWTIGAAKATLANLGLAGSSRAVAAAATTEAASGLLVANSWGTVTAATTEATVATAAQTSKFGALTAAAGPWVAVAALAAGAAVGLHQAFTNANGTLTVYTQNLLKLTDAQLKRASALILAKGGEGDFRNAVKATADQSEVTARKLVEGANLPKKAKEDLIRVIDREVAANARAAAAANSAAGATDNQTDSTKDLVDWIDIVNGKLNDQVDASLGSQGAAVSMDRSIKNLNETLAENGKETLEGRDAIIQAEQSVISFGKKIYDEKLAVSDSTQATKDQIGALSGVRDSLAPGSPLRTFLDGYIDQLNNHIPENVHTNFLLTLSNQTGLSIGDLQSLDVISSLPVFSAAQGGYFPARAGGYLVNVAEGGEDEVVGTPRDLAAKYGAGGSAVHIHFEGIPTGDPTQVGLKAAKAHRVYMEMAGR